MFCLQIQKQNRKNGQLKIYIIEMQVLSLQISQSTSPRASHLSMLHRLGTILKGHSYRHAVIYIKGSKG